MNYSDTTSALVINKLTKSQYETLKASGSLQSNQIYITPETLPSNLGDFNNDVGYVTASAVAASYATKGEVEVVTASVSSLASSVSALTSQVSAMASSLSAKRDYLDLTYNTTVPAETIDNSNLVDGTDPLYNAKLTFTVNDSVAGEQHLAYDELDGVGQWIDRSMDGGDHPQFFVYYAEDGGSDPADGKFVLIDSSDVCFQFNLQDGVNVQTFNYTSETLESTGTLTMTFTGEPAHQVNDTIALTGAVEVVSASVSTLTSQVNANTSAISANASAISANASAISANTSAIEANASAIASNASAISAVAGSLNVSGIGCSTIVLSGTYSDSTSFAYNFVIQPSA